MNKTDYGYIRNQIMFLAKRGLDISTIFIKIRDGYTDPRYEVIVETLVRISDVRKVAKMLTEGLYIEELSSSIAIFKRNGVNASELASMLNAFILENDKIVSRLLEGGADPNLIVEKASNETIQRHLDALIKSGADANMIAERMAQLDKHNGAWIIQTLSKANADINILIDHIGNEDIERWCRELIDAGASAELIAERIGKEEIIYQKAV